MIRPLHESRPPSPFGALRTARVLAAAVIVTTLAACRGAPEPPPLEPLPEPTYSGRRTCAECHVEELDAWEGSDHDRAMAVAGPQSVLGDFSGETVAFDGGRVRFHRRDDDYLVHTRGPEGDRRDFRVAYTFGADPVQQLLLPLDGGRYQAFGMGWDSRSSAEGGQRWLDLDPDAAPAPGDPAHWSGREHNWNSMCAACHSTGLRKGYDPRTRTYATTWAEVDVSCEACHGPGSNHVAWARGSRDPRIENAGLVVDLGDRSQRRWVVEPGAETATRQPPAGPPDAQTATCGRCHARRAPLVEAFEFGAPLADSYRVSLLEAGLYHADGQPREETFVYGSFLQSRAYRAGVTCSDCHDPHTGDTLLDGDDLCMKCHAADRFDGPQHTLHQRGDEALACVDCHMPLNVYLGVDARREHAFRVPRPDLAAQLGTPDVCTGCHAQRTATWAADRLRERFGEPTRGATWAPAMAAGRRGARGAGDALVQVANDSDLPGIVRATALSLVGRYPGPDALAAVRRGLNNDDPLVRQGALRALETADDRTKLLLVYPALRDRVRSVRVQAARLLSTIDLEAADETQAANIMAGVEELLGALRVNGDRPEFQLSLGVTLARTGRPQEAETAYRTAIALDPGSIPARVNLADLYRAQGRDDEGEQLLRRAVELAPDNPEVHHALGLLLIRRRRFDEAMPHLERAAAIRPGEPRYSLAFATALRARGDMASATEVLRRASRRNPDSLDILGALVDISRETGDLEAALRYARRIVELVPRDAAARRTVQELRAALAQ